MRQVVKIIAVVCLLAISVSVQAAEGEDRNRSSEELEERRLLEQEAAALEEIRNRLDLQSQSTTPAEQPAADATERTATSHELRPANGSAREAGVWNRFVRFFARQPQGPGSLDLGGPSGGSSGETGSDPLEHNEAEDEEDDEDEDEEDEEDEDEEDEEDDVSPSRPD